VPPVSGLKSPITAHHCQGPTCTVILASKDQIRKHSNKEHSWRKSDQQPTHWYNVKAQTFFIGALTKYFPVRVSGEENETVSGQPTSEADETIPRAAKQDLFKGLSQQHRTRVDQVLKQRQLFEQQHEEEMQKVDDEIAKQDRTGWFNRTEWPRHFAGRNLVHIAHCSRLPDKHELVLVEVVRMFDEVWIDASNGLASLDQETRRWLRSPKASEPDVRPIARL